MTMRSEFRRRINEERTLLVPLALDPLAGRQCQSLGFEAMYLSGGALGYQYAVSEALLTLTEICDVANRLTRRCDLPLIVDAGVGFGDAVHLTRAIWDIEATGAAAIEIEDQVAPKRVSHHRGIEHLISTEEMVAKVEHAVAARTDPDFVIIARTGAVANESFDAAIERAHAYVAAGADAILLQPQGDEQRRRAPELIDVPLVTFSSFAGRTADEWTDLGWSVVLDPFSAQVLAHQTVEHAYRRVLTEGDFGVSASDVMTGYRELPAAAGLDELFDIESATTERVD
ncbi:MAG: isocitrate lyase/PEP mutase family protein [Acidimicrobiales bacterium]